MEGEGRKTGGRRERRREEREKTQATGQWHRHKQQREEAAQEARRWALGPRWAGLQPI